MNQPATGASDSSRSDAPARRHDLREAREHVASREARRRVAVAGDLLRHHKAKPCKVSAARSDGVLIASYLNVRSAGRLVQLFLPGTLAGRPPSKRGRCVGMSDDSQRRLMNVLHSIRRDAPLPTMVSLTFPEECKVSPADAKRCRVAWEMRMRKRHPKFAAVWRIEAHPEMSKRLGRVCPHFHLLTWGAWFDLRHVSESWTSVVWAVLKIDAGLIGADGRDVREKHALAGTNCERVRKWEGVVYCAKTYIAKDEEFPIGKAGRVWGWCNEAGLPLAAEERIALTPKEVQTCIAAVRRWQVSVGITDPDVLVRSFYVDSPDRFVEGILRGEMRLPARKSRKGKS